MSKKWEEEFLDLVEKACGRELSLKVDSGNRCAASILWEFSA